MIDHDDRLAMMAAVLPADGNGLAVGSHHAAHAIRIEVVHRALAVAPDHCVTIGWIAADVTAGPEFEPGLIDKCLLSSVISG